MKKLYLIIGAPGSGKTSDAEVIAKESSGSIVHLSTGNLLRDEVASGSALGELLNGYMSKGALVPLRHIIEILIAAIKNTDANTVVVDGYPRSLEQMNELDIILNEQSDIKLEMVIVVNVSDATARARVLGRARGDDDKESVFNDRMRIYLEPIDAIKEFYADKGLLEEVDGEGTLEEIVAAIKKLMR